MIKTKIKDYLEYEKRNYGFTNHDLVIKKLGNSEKYIIWKFQSLLRKSEYYKNTNKKILCLFFMQKIK